MVLFVNPAAVDLYFWMRDFGCGHPISTRVFRRETIVLTVMYRAASSASTSDAITDLMICAIVNTAPFNGGVGTFSDRNIWSPALLRALDSLMNLASECAASIRSLALKRIP